MIYKKQNCKYDANSDVFNIEHKINSLREQTHDKMKNKQKKNVHPPHFVLKPMIFESIRSLWMQIYEIDHVNCVVHKADDMMLLAFFFYFKSQPIFDQYYSIRYVFFFFLVVYRKMAINKCVANCFYFILT